MSNEILPFKVEVPQAALDDLRHRLVRTRWPERGSGAEFLTPPIDRGEEIRCYLRDADGHLIEVGQLVRSLG